MAASRQAETDQLTRLRIGLGSRYTVERELGRGGMGTVYLAYDQKHDRMVAIKVLRPELAAALGLDRFLREIQIVARLNHPHIVPLYDSGEAEGLLYFVMPYVEGEALRARLEREKQLSLDDALQIAREVADALSYAHGHNVVHRDIRPENILLESGHAVVTDFGIARAIRTAGVHRLTPTGFAVGSPAYMSPEQAAADEELDGRSDLYSLGCVLYEMLAGHPPFTGFSAQEVLARHSVDAVPRLSAARATIPEPIGAAVERVLAKAPADRYRSASEFVAALAMDVEAHRRRQSRRAWARRLAVGAGVIALLGAGGWGVLRYWRATQWKAQPVNANIVAVMPFRATAIDPRLGNLGEGVMDLLFAVLTGDVGPRAVEPGSLLRKWADMTARGEAATADAPLKLAAHFGAGLLLEGGVVQSGSQLTVNAWLRAVPEGRELARATVVGRVDSLGALPQRLVVRLLGRQLGEDVERVASLANQDPEAVKAYLAGLQTYRRGAYREAEEHFSRALALDSTFALAALALGRSNRADVRPAGRAYRLAEQLRGRLSRRDRAELDAFWGIMDSLPRAMVASAESWVAISPEDPMAQLNYGLTLRSCAPLGLPNSQARAARAWATAWALDSVTPGFVALVARSAAKMGDLAWLRRLGPQYLAVADTTTDWWPALRWTIAIAQGDSATVRALRSRAAAGDPSLSMRRAQWALTVLSIAAGLPLADADLLTRQGALQARTMDDSEDAYNPIVALAMGRMHHVAAFTTSRYRWFREVGGLASARNWIWVLDLWLAYPGLDNAAAAAADSLRGWVAAGGEFPRSRAALVNGAFFGDGRCYLLVYRAARGDTAGVRAAARHIEAEAGSQSPGSLCPLLAEALVESRDLLRTSTPALDSLESAERSRAYFTPHLSLVARLRRARGQLDRALPAARALFYGTGLDFQTFTPHLREEGYAAAALGDTAGAIWAFTHYLTLKTDPDPGPATEERDQVRVALSDLRAGGRSAWSQRDGGVGPRARGAKHLLLERATQRTQRH